jgi:hypothetical protein
MFQNTFNLKDADMGDLHHCSFAGSLYAWAELDDFVRWVDE